MNPLVTCLCLTRNRREWLPRAIACFQAQTYEPRELLIVADGDDVRDLVAGLPSLPVVRLVCAESGLTIGAKRNFGCDLARGPVVAHWDDDDYSAPGRLADQVERLLRSGKSVTGYSTMRFTDGVKSWEYVPLPALAAQTGQGTSLVYRRSWWATHPFYDVKSGEDSAFASQAFAAGEFVTAPAGEQLVAWVHPGNTAEKSLRGCNWREL
jgi:glycosyltransferase involved in cell wall biosynthesis